MEDSVGTPNDNQGESSINARKARRSSGPGGAQRKLRPRSGKSLANSGVYSRRENFCLFLLKRTVMISLQRGWLKPGQERKESTFENWYQRK
ncbi:hypothetical protein NDU88_005524 [Pleurodeles waltl]|uniref:Uncharacterized protein n=1 Tax=Pleurodeles waltl TaxID=8319 RepID=A0AAV7WYZ3_PLEWA|nr:hypothetical protein NDU88_005524 [Pleurodeles waltl]